MYRVSERDLMEAKKQIEKIERFAYLLNTDIKPSIVVEKINSILVELAITLPRPMTKPTDKTIPIKYVEMETLTNIKKLVSFVINREKGFYQAYTIAGTCL